MCLIFENIYVHNNERELIKIPQYWLKRRQIHVTEIGRNNLRYVIIARDLRRRIAF